MKDTIVMNEQLAEDRKSILENVLPALRRKIEWIIDWQKQELSCSLLGRWDLGHEIDEVYRDHDMNGGRVFGRKAKSTIATFLREDPSVVNMAHSLYRTYPDRKVLVDITEMVMVDGMTH